MKISINKIVFAAIILFLFNISYLQAAEPAPGDAGTKFICAGDLTLPALTAGATYTVMYSASSDQINTASAITLNSGNIIPNAQTGYYFIMTKSAGVNACLSDAQVIPVFALPALNVAIAGADYCSENANTSTIALTATVANNPAGLTSFAHQWYTVEGAVETAIAGQTNINFTPTATNSTATEISTTYRLKTAYLINGNKYCAVITDKVIKVLPTPTKPAIAIGVTAEAW